MRFLKSPIVADQVTAHDKRLRFILFAVWLALVAWLASGHIFWRDEVRAYSLALAGTTLPEMLGTIHGEGHPAIWYLLLRGAHELIPVREVLPVLAALIGIATAAIIAFRSPFRLGIVALVLFSYFSAFEYTVVARNYGIAALVMVVLAALYPRVKDSLWFGALIAILANTNVPAAILAAAFMLFRFVELISQHRAAVRRQWLAFGGNCLLALAGAYICFRTIYPTFNDGAVSPNLAAWGGNTILAALTSTDTGFREIAGGTGSFLLLALVMVTSAAFARTPAALIAAIFAFVSLKLFFYFIYPSSYRHEALYLVFLLALHWMAAEGAAGEWRFKSPQWVGAIGCWALVELLALQSLLLLTPIAAEGAGRPYSRAADVGDLLKQRGLSEAIVMADPDPLLEALPYHADNPLWFLRERRFGTVVRLTQRGRKDLTLDDVLLDSEILHRRTGRPIVFLSRQRLDSVPRRTKVMYESTTTLTPDSVARFKASTRHLARLRPAATDEQYDVYLYPR